MTRFNIQTHLRRAAAIALVCISAGLLAAPSNAQNALANGDFESNPPPNLGNNFGASYAAPWTMNGGSFNVIKVDGSGPYIYAANYPANDVDASNPGAVAQHYLDVAGGTGSFYQEFVPKCSGAVMFGAAFSFADETVAGGATGSAGLTIKLASDGSIVVPRQAASEPGGNTASNPWTSFSFGASLTAGTAYRFEVDMNDWAAMDNAFVEFETFCDAYSEGPADFSTVKTCDQPVAMPDGSYKVACQIEVDFPNGPPMDAQGNVLAVSIHDDLTRAGAPIGSAMQASSSDPWVCGPGTAPGVSGVPGPPVSLTCSLTSAATASVASSSANGLAGYSVISIATTLPAGTRGPVQNCAYSSYYLSPDVPTTSEPSCVTINLPAPTPAPVQCEAFTPEVTCNTVTGKPVVTLKNKYAALFSPKSVQITSLTPGVTVQASQSNALSVQLTGANPGDTIRLSTEAIEKGAGSEPGLDLCCMGEIEVKIPEGFICEPERVLEVTKTCDTGINPAIDTDADCEITVHYEGPPPSASNPIKIVEAVTGNPWAFTTTPLSGDNWHCPAVPDATPFTCTISAADEPGANWQNWTSTLIVQMSVGEEFENCVTATAAGGLEDRVCWSTEQPELTIEKIADQEMCMAGEPCMFTINVTNPSGTDYTGPISLQDQIVNVTPSVLNGAGNFTAITPALCPIADLNGGTCTGQASIAAGQTQSYSVVWIPPAPMAGTEADEILVTNCVSGTSGAGPMSVTGAPDAESGNEDPQSCATVTLTEDELTVEKTGPLECLPGQPCDYTVTVSAGAGGYNGPLLLGDQAPAGFQVTAITPAPTGCGANLPADTLVCVVPVSLNPGDSVSYTISITPLPGTLDSPYQHENCALIGSVGPQTAAADYSFSGHDMPEALQGLISAGTILGQSCAPVIGNPDDPQDPDVDIVKTCGPVQQTGPHASAQCTITVTTTGPIQSNLTVSDDFTGMGQASFTTTEPGWTCANGQCQIAGGQLNQTGSVSTFGIQVMFDPGAPAQGTNCGVLSLGAQEHARSCVPIVDEPEGDVSLLKTCTPLTEEESPVLSYTTTCTITLTTTQDLLAQVSVADTIVQGNGTLGALTPVSGAWSCGNGACLIGPVTAGSYALTTTVTGITGAAGSDWSNCADGILTPTGTGMTEADGSAVPQSCTLLTVPPIGDPDGDSEPPTLTKTCAPAVPGPMGLTSTCAIVVTSNAFPQPHHLTVTETLGQYLDASDTGASISAITHAEPWVASGALPVPPATPFTLTLPGNDMPASGQSVINVTVQLMNEGYLMETDNCAEVQAYDAANQPIGASQQVCADFPPPATGKIAAVPAISLAKTATGPCVPDVAAQTYACPFDLTVTNAGAAFAGPLVLGDAFDAGMVTAVTTTGAGWSCAQAGDAASCINGNLSLATGASSTVSLVATVKGQPQGGTFTNCGSIGASDDPTAQAVIVQTALTLMGVDIGAVDGKPGKRTRAAVADLQKQLGLDATGQIDAGLLAALGVPLASDADKACVTVDLPPMPRPPVQCEKATTRLVDGACECRFKNMYQADKTSCGCVKGTSFVAGEGCLKVKDKPKDTPKALKCDPETTVLRNGKCACREEGMERVSKTQCAKVKKKKEIRICPNGLPEIPGVGCVDIKIKRGDGDGGRCNPAVQECG